MLANNPDVRPIAHIIRDVLSNLDGSKTVEEIEDQICAELDDDEQLFYFRETLHAKVKNEVALASLDKEDPQKTAQLGLLPDAYLNRLMKRHDGSVIRVRHCTLDDHDDHRERQIHNMRLANAKFEQDEKRREVLRPIMAGTDMTTEQAVWKLQKK